MQLYTYFRSSSAYRVRIALNLKGLRAEMIPVNLLKDEQKSVEHLQRNPQGLVPVLADGGQTLTQSLAIMEYLEETYPSPPLLPNTPAERARVRAIALAIACEMHPLNNLQVLKYLIGPMGLSEEKKTEWYKHWIAQGFQAVESMLTSSKTGIFCHGDTPTMADCCLVPQVYNAKRFACDLSPYPKIVKIAEACDKLPAFAEARPEKQKDAKE